MISISGIKYQKELEELPFFNKVQAETLIGKSGRNLDKKISQLMKKGYLISLKKGLYTTGDYFGKSEKQYFTEYLANILRSPSYISCEYVLAKSNLIPESVFSITSITTKSSRRYSNILGGFIYRNLPQHLFTGYRTITWKDKYIYIASKAKALFDLLYLKKLTDPKQEIVSDLRINWDNFTSGDKKEFNRYVKLADSRKMTAIMKIINEYAA